MKIYFDLAQPIYMQIIDEFKKSLARGELAQGDKIPSQRELAQKIKVNPNTVQKSYQEMERIGLVETLRGQGTFITKEPKILENIRDEMVRAAMKNFFREMYSLGYQPKEIMGILAKELEKEAQSEDNER